jgi:hypothetical protein
MTLFYKSVLHSQLFSWTVAVAAIVAFVAATALAVAPVNVEAVAVEDNAA